MEPSSGSIWKYSEELLESVCISYRTFWLIPMGNGTNLIQVNQTYIYKTKVSVYLDSHIHKTNNSVFLPQQIHILLPDFLYHMSVLTK